MISYFGRRGYSMGTYRESIDVSSQQWFEMLQDRNVFKDNDITLMKALFNCKNHKEKASVLAIILGVSGHPVLNLQIGRLGKRITDKLPNAKFPSRENGSIQYWHIPFWAADSKNFFCIVGESFAQDFCGVINLVKNVKLSLTKEKHY